MNSKRFRPEVVGLPRYGPLPIRGERQIKLKSGSMAEITFFCNSFSYERELHYRTQFEKARSVSEKADIAVLFVTDARPAEWPPRQWLERYPDSLPGTLMPAGTDKAPQAPALL